MKWDFTMTQHIFLTGKKHIGKSTLIQKILDDYKKTSDGFLTVRTKNYLKDQYSVHTVSYTHLDVYKRQQVLSSLLRENPHEWETLNPCFNLDLFPLRSA